MGAVRRWWDRHVWSIERPTLRWQVQYRVAYLFAWWRDWRRGIK